MVERKQKKTTATNAFKRFKVFVLVKKEKGNLTFANQENEQERVTISESCFRVRKEKYCGPSHPLLDLL